jgi:hypothetical protein
MTTSLKLEVEQGRTSYWPGEMAAAHISRGWPVPSGASHDGTPSALSRMKNSLGNAAASDVLLDGSSRSRGSESPTVSILQMCTLVIGFVGEQTPTMRAKPVGAMRTEIWAMVGVRTKPREESLLSGAGVKPAIPFSDR